MTWPLVRAVNRYQNVIAPRLSKGCEPTSDSTGRLDVATGISATRINQGQTQSACWTKLSTARKKLSVLGCGRLLPSLRCPPGIPVCSVRKNACRTLSSSNGARQGRSDTPAGHHDGERERHIHMYGGREKTTSTERADHSYNRPRNRSVQRL